MSVELLGLHAEIGEDVRYVADVQRHDLAEALDLRVWGQETVSL